VTSLTERVEQSTERRLKLQDWTMMDGVAMVDIAAAAAAAAEVGADDAVDRNATQQFFCVSS